MNHAIKRFVMLAVLVGILFVACESPVGSEDPLPGSEGTPLPPSSLTAAAVSVGRIALNWTDNSGDETGFRIERSVESGTSGFSQIALVGANVTTYDDSGLAAATRYWYRVRAFNGFGDSACCSPADAVTLSAADTQAPSIPSGLSASAVSSSQINLNWSASTDNVGVAGYKVYRGGSYLKSVTGTSASDTGLSPGTAYSYQVSAYDAAGNESAKSSTVGAVTWTVVTLYPQYDNMVMTQSNDSTVANKVYASGELAVGVNWQWNWYAGYGYMQDFLAAASLVKFDTSTLSGRTIEAATLTLCVQYYGTGYFPRTWYIRALATSWSSTTVTWNVLEGLNYYTASEIAQTPPVNYSDYVINLKPTVQNWANGAYANHGLCFVQGNYAFPNMTSWDAFAFYSKEASSASLRPRLTVTYR